MEKYHKEDPPKKDGAVVIHHQHPTKIADTLQQNKKIFASVLATIQLSRHIESKILFKLNVYKLTRRDGVYYYSFERTKTLYKDVAYLVTLLINQLIT